MILFKCPSCNWEGKAKVICERTKANLIDAPKGWFIDKYVKCSKCGKVELVNPCLVPDVILDLTTKEWNKKTHMLSPLHLDIMNKKRHFKWI